MIQLGISWLKSMPVVDTDSLKNQPWASGCPFASGRLTVASGLGASVTLAHTGFRMSYGWCIWWWLNFADYYDLVVYSWRYACQLIYAVTKLGYLLRNFCKSMENMFWLCLILIRRKLFSNDADLLEGRNSHVPRCWKQILLAVSNDGSCWRQYCHQLLEQP